MAFEELKEAGSESAVKAKGRYRQEGKGYTVEDGDVIFFKLCAAAPPPAAHHYDVTRHSALTRTPTRARSNATAQGKK